MACFWPALVCLSHGSFVKGAKQQPSVACACTGLAVRVDAVCVLEREVDLP